MADDPEQQSDDAPAKEDNAEAPKATIPYQGKDLTPEEVLDRLREKDAYITRQGQELAEFKKQPEPEESDDDFAREAQIRAAKKQLGLPENESIEEFLDKKLSQREQNAKINRQVTELESRYNGEGDNKDYPKFNAEEVIRYSTENNIYDLEAAYRQMNYGKILDAEVKKAQAKSEPPTPDASDSPRTEPTDKETLKKLVEEADGDPTKLAQVLVKTGQGLREKT